MDILTFIRVDADSSFEADRLRTRLQPMNTSAVDL
jgi:hypothetical protein